MQIILELILFVVDSLCLSRLKYMYRDIGELEISDNSSTANAETTNLISNDRLASWSYVATCDFVLLIGCFLAPQDLLACKIDSTIEKSVVSKKLSIRGEKEKIEMINAKGVTSRFIILIYLNFCFRS